MNFHPSQFCGGFFASELPLIILNPEDSFNRKISEEI